MEDVRETFEKNICIFCLNNKCEKCFNLQTKKNGNLTTYKCANFQKGVTKMKEFQEFIYYTFYDETGEYIAIIHKDTPKEIITKLEEKYDQVRFKE